ncbi:hypothetical protein GQ53DRAFT_745351 [Thozetella sp. PMI_491]|nr:hypothetical protein GQ53DRAFT_745351 [Thozetella sp. PMI_491]
MRGSLMFLLAGLLQSSLAAALCTRDNTTTSVDQIALASAVVDSILAPSITDQQQLAFSASSQTSFFLIFIADSEAIFNATFDQFISKQHQEDMNNIWGTPLTFDGLKAALLGLRRSLSSRKLISIKTVLGPEVAVPGRPGTNTGGHTLEISGIDVSGEIVLLNVVAVGTAIFLEGGGAQMVFEKMVITRNPLN